MRCRRRRGAETVQELAHRGQERSLELGRSGSNLWTERRRARCATGHAGRSDDEELHCLRDARVGSLLDIPRREELHGEVTNLAPIFIAPEPLLKPISELVAKYRLNVSPLEAARGADHALGEGVDVPSQLGQGAIDQLIFHLPSLGFLLSRLPLKPSSLDQALDERLHGVHGGRRAEMIVPRPSTTGDRRAEISGRAKSDSLLRDQEAVCLQVVAGARNHLPANRSLGFCFEIAV